MQIVQVHPDDIHIANDIKSFHVDDYFSVANSEDREFQRKFTEILKPYSFTLQSGSLITEGLPNIQ